jgi:hypothetical protein
LQITSSANPIEQSFEVGAACCEDLTPLVYPRLHREHPETRAMFRSEGSEPVKGSMLAMTIESILDFARPAQRQIPYDRMRAILARPTRAISKSGAQVLGPCANCSEWSPQIDAAWQQLPADVEDVVVQS